MPLPNKWALGNVTGVDVDDQRHIYVTESGEGKRVQRFVYKGLGPAQIR